MKLTVGTFNICHCGDWRDPKPILDKTAKLEVAVDEYAKNLSEIGYDVVGLNEVYSFGPDERFIKQTEQLVEKSSFRYGRFAQGKEFDWKDIIGNSVLSKYPIIETEKIPVPAPDEDHRDKNENNWFEDRVIIKTIIDINGKEIAFISTHFGLNLSEQRNIVNALIKILDKLKIPCVLAGDFNTTPNAEVLKPIRERLKSAADELGKTNDATWATFSPETTIDYIFVSKDVKVVDYGVVDLVLSDHFPLKATIEI